MQLTENDQTALMPATLPTNFFIPSDDYDVANSGAPAGPPVLTAPAPVTGNITTTSATISSSVQNALQAANIPPSLITQIENSITTQIQQHVVG